MNITAFFANYKESKMIKYLEGKKETVAFDKLPTFMLYDNVDLEEYPYHWHAPIEIIMPLENNYTVSCDGKVYDLDVNDVLIIFPGVVHKCHACPGRRIIFQAAISKFAILNDFNTKFNHDMAAMLISKDSHADIHSQCVSIMLNIMDEYFSKDIAKEYAIASDLLKILELILRFSVNQTKVSSDNLSKHHSNIEIFDQIREFTMKHCTENLTLDEIAAKSGFSKFYFSRAFKDYTGISYYRYLNVCRINYSAELLIDPDISITEVAISSGFNSISSFIRMFKQIKGCTPSEYRKMKETFVDPLS